MKIPAGISLPSMVAPHVVFSPQAVIEDITAAAAATAVIFFILNLAI